MKYYLGLIIVLITITFSAIILRSSHEDSSRITLTSAHGESGIEADRIMHRRDNDVAMLASSTEMRIGRILSIPDDEIMFSAEALPSMNRILLFSFGHTRQSVHRVRVIDFTSDQVMFEMNSNSHPFLLNATSFSFLDPNHFLMLTDVPPARNNPTDSGGSSISLISIDEKKAENIKAFNSRFTSIVGVVGDRVWIQDLDRKAEARLFAFDIANRTIQDVFPSSLWESAYRKIVENGIKDANGSFSRLRFIPNSEQMTFIMLGEDGDDTNYLVRVDPIEQTLSVEDTIQIPRFRFVSHNWIDAETVVLSGDDRVVVATQDGYKEVLNSPGIGSVIGASRRGLLLSGNRDLSEFRSGRRSISEEAPTLRRVFWHEMEL